MVAGRIVCFVLCGGVGSRLSPLSTAEIPKQFLPLFGDDTMLSSTVARLAARPAGEAPIHLVASHEDGPLLEGHVGSTGLCGGEVLLEPARRNTALAVAVAAAFTLGRFGDDLVLVTPSDHCIETSGAFWSAVEAGADAAREGRLVVFGIRPTRPETGFGYIHASGRECSSNVFEVAGFHEKPDRNTAVGYLETGDHFWNAGLFLFSPAALRQRLLELGPDIWDAASLALQDAVPGDHGLLLAPDAYENAPTASFDKAIVERTTDVAMVPAAFRWRDVGTWRSLVEVTLGRW